jgi:hypothetical protein
LLKLLLSLLPFVWFILILCSFGSGLLFFTLAIISLFDLISLFNLVIGLSLS